MGHADEDKIMSEEEDTHLLRNSPPNEVVLHGKLPAAKSPHRQAQHGLNQEDISGLSQSHAEISWACIWAEVV